MCVSGTQVLDDVRQRRGGTRRTRELRHTHLEIRGVRSAIWPLRVFVHPKSILLEAPISEQASRLIGIEEDGGVLVEGAYPFLGDDDRRATLGISGQEITKLRTLSQRRRGPTDAPGKEHQREDEPNEATHRTSLLGLPQ